MFKLFILPAVLLFASVSLSAQNTKPFELAVPTAKIKNSLYNKLQCLDSRPDTTFAGIVQTGFFNRNARVIPTKPLPVQFAGVFSALTDTTAGHGELLLQLRQFSFAEITGSFSEKGYCYMSAELYAKEAGQYQKVSTIDTVIMLKSSIDVTTAILKAGSLTMTNFVSNNLLNKPCGAIYTYNDVIHIDDIEKRATPLYNSAAYTDGVYETYRSFMKQVPDKQIMVEGYQIYPDAIKASDSNGKLKKVKPQNIYAIVYKGQPYVTSLGAYYLLTKTKDDFFFTGKAKVAPTSGELITAQAFFGIIGGLMAANQDATFEMKIDHKNGGFIKLKEIPEAPSNYQPGGD